MLSRLSDQASVWIFQSDQHLQPSQIEYVNSALKSFVPNWAAHGASLKADFEVIKDLFIIIGVDENHVSASGCSKDALTREIKMIGEKIEIDFFDRLKIAYINKEDKIDLVDMISFKELIQKDIIRRNTIVYNNLVVTKKELLENWEVQLNDSWHANLMPIL